MTRLAALDLGSNSFHLLVADERGGGRIERVATRKLTLRLAEPITAEGELGRQGRARARDAVTELLAVARAEGARHAVAVATEALRQAADSEKFRDRLRRDHGLIVQVLDGLAEAELSLRGMAVSLREPGELLGMDLGGGSFEVAYGTGGDLTAGATLPLGAARLTARARHDPPRMAERARLHAEALEQLAPLAAEVAGMRGDAAPPLRAAGTAGTLRDLGRLGLALAGGAAPLKVRGLVVTREQVETAVAHLVSMPTHERMALPGVSEKRADLLPAGGTVLLAAMEAFALEQLTLCDWGLREGALLDLLGPRRVVDADLALAL